MKKILALITLLSLVTGVFYGCSDKKNETVDGTKIALSDSGITVDGKDITNDTLQAVYSANDIVYYEEGHDFTYGEGDENDSHSESAAKAHTVVHITKAGNYIISGKLSKGQIAVDLGEDAKESPDAVVTLTLDNADITCEVAPAVIFYSVYECGTTDEDSATKDVDTSKAGANIIIADGSENNITGSYVAKIYKPDSIVFNEDKTEVEDAKKLHKYDGAFYSKMSMNINGGEKGDGRLNLTAENEGLDSELHLTINSGNINIVSGNDGINTNEDNISVTTINGGTVSILADGGTGEGDGIDSNGWLVINGGTVFAQGCGISGDAGIDSDKGIHLNGGTVFATGNMLDRISESKQNFTVFSFAQAQDKGTYTLKNSKNAIISENSVENKFTYLVLSSPELTEGDYTLWNGETQLQGTKGQSGMGGGHPMQEPSEGFSRPEDFSRPEGFTLPEGMIRPEKPDDRTFPEGTTPPDDMPARGERPEGEEPPSTPDGVQPPDGNPQDFTGKISETFTITDGANYFSSVSAIK
ncbi:MAG: carbohydrate-binding domain-containing protein [Clostridia bacterium]|nr:carbohydrate-binding domain-containing protein [Clostridia bacterium]